MDSLTRVAAARPESVLPPANANVKAIRRLYSPCCRPSLSAGPGRDRPGGTIPACSRCWSGDDHDEPIADAARAILDGHIVLSRKIAERGPLFPQSIS
ncbi:MAG: hypothetical protein R3C40_09290 [Parvularculaceae bacterium]